jgi:membrane-bound lytic murein transglycosylase B
MNRTLAPSSAPTSWPRPGRTALSLLSLTLVSACSTFSPSKPPAPVVSIALGRSESPEPTLSASATMTVTRKVLPPLPAPVNPPANSYALRSDAKALAERLADKHGLDPAWAASVLAQAQSSDTVAKLIMPAASPGAKNWGLYRSRFVEPIRIKAGVAFWRANEPTLRRAQNEYGVPMEIIAGILGVETIYGRQTGNFRILDALGTLSLDFPKGRSDRSAFFQDELGEFLRMCAEQRLDPTSVQGSFAGAMGLPQFMPSSVRRFAVDYDSDGQIDLRNSQADAIGSVAKYLSLNGWQRGIPTHFSVIPPKDEAAKGKLLAPDILPSFTVAQLQQSGALLDITGQNHPGLLALVQLFNGGQEPSYLAGTANFYAITRYNQSSYYALAVIELGKAVAQAARPDGS